MAARASAARFLLAPFRCLALLGLGIAEVFALNMVLAALAIAAATGSATTGMLSFLFGALAVALVLLHFARKRQG